MSQRRFLLIVACLVAVFFVWSSCTSQKNTAVTRWYHATNTHYNIHFNAQQAYDEALKAKNSAYKDNMTEMLYVLPFEASSLDKKSQGGSFNKVIDKCVKAIKLHSIQKKPIKDASKRGNAEYQKWFKQKEFNPYLKNSWLLMAKAEYQNDDYLKSISTFSYITRIFANDPEVVAEARLWMVKAYSQLGWYYEAEDILKKMELNGGVPKHLEGQFAAANANLLLRQKKYQEAVPFLVTAAERGESGWERTRYKYILGQTYEKLGKRTMAYQVFSEIGGLNTPFVYELNARLKQAENSDPSSASKNLDMLDGFAGNSKYKDYLDQVYYAKGNIYLNKQDTLNALSAYAKAVAKSTRNGAEKAHVQVTLGDLYFGRKEYVKAQPYYSGAMSILQKDHPDYSRVALRSQVLEQLAAQEQAIHLQDSLQALVRMPEQARNDVIDKIISDLVKQEKEAKLSAAREKADANAAARPGMAGNVDIPLLPNTQGGFYFDNEQSIAQGKNSFQQKWGNRKFEDNWRRRDKSLIVSLDQTESASEGAKKDSTGKQEEHVPSFTPSNDPHKREYYLAQLPFSKLQLAASDKIIDDALFLMGVIYREQLNDSRLAVEAYETELTRFPYTPNKQEIYYRLYLLYYELGNKTMAENYRRKMMADFPQSNYAKAFADPDYEWNLQNPEKLQNALYEKTYEAYLRSDVAAVHQGYEDIQSKFPQSELMPKFIFLNALTYAQSKEEDKFRDGLKEILSKYPKSDVAAVATDMMKQSMAGKELAGGGPLKGMIWNASFGKNEDLTATKDSSMQFKRNDNVAQMLALVYPLTKINKNDLLYTLADYNFSHYVISTFDLIFDDQANTGILLVKGFENFRYLSQYINDASKNSLFSQLGEEVIPVPISNENYVILQSGRTLNDYLAFFDTTYGSNFPQLTALWKSQKSATVQEKQLAENDSKSGKQSVPEAKTETISDTIPVKPEPSPVPAKSLKDIDISTIKAPSIVAKTETPEVVLTEEEKEQVKAANNSGLEILNQVNLSNPVEGLKNIIKQKLPKKEKIKDERTEKLSKAEIARIAKAQRAVERAQKDSLKAVWRTQKAAEQAVEKVRQDSVKAIAKEKQDVQREKDNAEKTRKEEIKRKEQQRKDDLKAREKARNEKLKQREKERREKERQQKEKLKERERERQQKAKKTNLPSG